MVNTENKPRPSEERERSQIPNVPAAIGLATALLVSPTAEAQQPGGAGEIVAAARSAERAPMTIDTLRLNATGIASKVIGVGTNPPSALQLARLTSELDLLMKAMYRDIPGAASVKPDKLLPAPVHELPSELRLAVSLDVLKTRLKNAEGVLNEGEKARIELHPERVLDNSASGAVIAKPEQERQKRLGVYWSQSLAAAGKVMARAADTSPPFIR